MEAGGGQKKRTRDPDQQEPQLPARIPPLLPPRGPQEGGVRGRGSFGGRRGRWITHGMRRSF